MLKNELRISASQLGILLSAFFWTYAALLFVCGWFVDRFDVNRVLAFGYLIWSLATAATGMVRGFKTLLIMRLILGMGSNGVTGVEFMDVPEVEKQRILEIIYLAIALRRR